MKYSDTVKEIQVGDIVRADGLDGIVVCDYENNIALDGYEGWLIKDELVGGGYLSTGIMVETEEAGYIYYPNEDVDIKLVSPAKGG
ncbi:hypothetical protein YV76_000945 [Salmonella enterica subsp. enterica]|nr:hypothetical protein [Salmonella enterica subsp. enterica]